ncbi:MAG: L-serine ammonia-lyase, iron-sulfur-dependent, subunit alpha, partial [Lachnospiraceae bacterium]|nr:L-serine ammonia-lyase, iron-sulfur-dependent, subunit alpha [Lachnospiraceae bacterium]
CDGAKPSCAGKIASAVDAAILGYRMFKEGQEFVSGDGIVTKGVDNTIENVGRMAREGMRETDEEILKIMVEEKESKD